MQPPPGLTDPSETLFKPSQYLFDLNTYSKLLNFQQSNHTLESLKLELNQDDNENDPQDISKPVEDSHFNQIELSNQDGLCYLEPSLNNLTFTSDGSIIDTAGSSYLGLWDKNMKFQKLWQGLLENIASIRILALPKNQLLVSQFTTIYLIDLNEGKRESIWQIETTFDVIFLTQHSPSRLFAFAQGEFYVWKTNFQNGKGCKEPIFNVSIFKNEDSLKKNEFLELKHKKITKFYNCDDIIVLENGIILGKNNKQGEVYEIDIDKDKISELSLTSGSVIQNWVAIEWDRVVMSRQQSIILVHFKNQLGQIYQTLNAGTEDVMQGIVLLKYNRIASISNKSVIKVYDLKKGICIHSYGTEKKINSVYNLRTLDKQVLAMTCLENKEFQLMNLTQNEEGVTIENYFKYKVRVKRVLDCIIEGDYIVIYQQSGLFFAGQVDFHKEIEIYGAYDKQFIRKKVVGDIDSSTILITEGEIQLGDDSSSDDSFHSNDDKPIHKDICLKYIKDKTIYSWFFLLNQTKEQKINLDIQKVVCKQYKFKRLVVNYSDVQQLQQSNINTFNLFEPTLKKSQSNQELFGIKVYDDDMDQMIEIQLNQQCHIFGMLNRDLLYFLNSKNQIESWSMQTQKIVQKADCRPAIIKQLYFLGDQLFMFASSEWIVRDQKLGLIGKRKGSNHAPKKVLKLNRNLIVVQDRNQVIIWKIKENTINSIDCGFTVASIGYLSDSKLFVAGDCEMKIVNIDF